ncbi:hypothetical protein C8J57DRAFT_1253885 [Mycena rebaudengoi]|nr:hypothetical protein C8J57DRAFT_1253885 [Mycena rebaudengoi]
MGTAEPLQTIAGKAKVVRTRTCGCATDAKHEKPPRFCETPTRFSRLPHAAEPHGVPHPHAAPTRGRARYAVLADGGDDRSGGGGGGAAVASRRGLFVLRDQPGISSERGGDVEGGRRIKCGRTARGDTVRRAHWARRVRACTAYTGAVDGSRPRNRSRAARPGRGGGRAKGERAAGDSVTGGLCIPREDALGDPQARWSIAINAASANMRLPSSSGGRMSSIFVRW